MSELEPYLYQAAAGCWDDTRRISRSSGRSSSAGPSNETSIRGSHEELLGGITVDKSAWSNVTGFAAACSAATINYHSLFLLPLSVVKNGGLAFLVLYSVLLVIIGAPLVLMEMFLGQYSSLAGVHIYYNICPLMSGLGVAMYVTVIIRAVLNISVMVWVSRAVYDIFALLDTNMGLETIKDVAELQHQTPTVDGLFSLEYTELITLAVIIVIMFVLAVGGVAAIGRICQLGLASSLLLMVTLTIRCCLSPSGGQAVKSLLAPDWSHLTQPRVWLEAVVQVVMSLHLGLGVISTYASHNGYSHNIVRDSVIVTSGHWVWSMVSTVFMSAMLGMSQVSLTDIHGVMDCLVTAGRAMEVISQGWLWLGLVFILVIIITINSTLGYITVIVSIIPKLKLALATPICLALLFFLSLIICNEAGPHIFLVISSHLTSWPPILFSLLSVLVLVWSHDLRYLESDLTSVTSMLLPHFITSHLASLLYTFIPISLSAGLYASIRNLVDSDKILLTSMTLPVVPIMIGALIMTGRALRNYPRIVVSS